MRERMGKSARGYRREGRACGVDAHAKAGGGALASLREGASPRTRDATLCASTAPDPTCPV